MPSGFIIMNDGRCVAPNTRRYDFILRLVIAEITDLGDEGAFKAWLKTRIPAEGDFENGFGGFIHPVTHEQIMRDLDLRELTLANQGRFWKGLQQGTRRLILARDNQFDSILFLLKKMLRMRRLILIRDRPDNLSEWRKGYVKPPTGEKVGPGW